MLILSLDNSLNINDCVQKTLLVKVDYPVVSHIWNKYGD
jgi:hypothetical protein